MKLTDFWAEIATFWSDYVLRRFDNIFHKNSSEKVSVDDRSFLSLLRKEIKL